MFKDPSPASPADAELQVQAGLKHAESLWHFSCIGCAVLSEIKEGGPYDMGISLLGNPCISGRLRRHLIEYRLRPCNGLC